jgi:microcystin-dependent protein
MSINDTTVQLEFTNVVANQVITVNMQTSGIDGEIYVTYGATRYSATSSIDYDTSFPDASLLTFNITIYQALIDKINAAAEVNVIYVRRHLPMTSDFDYDNVYVREKLVAEFDRVWMACQEFYQFLEISPVPANTVYAGPPSGADAIPTFRKLNLIDLQSLNPTGTGVPVLQNTPTINSPVIHTPTGIVKNDVGLGNVDNTSDATKNAANVALTNHTINASANAISNIADGNIMAAAHIDATKISSGVVTNAEFDTLDGIASNIQAQINLIQPTVPQSLKNKTLDNTNTVTLYDNKFTLQDDAAPAKQAQFDASGITNGQTRILALPDANDTLAVLNLAQTVKNKTIDDTNNITIKDANLTIEDDVDPTKKFKFDISPLNTGVSVTVKLPSANNDILVAANLPQTLTAKAIDANNNTITNLADAAIKAGANIDAAKIGTGIVSTIEYNYLDGLTSNIQSQINAITAGGGPGLAPIAPLIPAADNFPYYTGVSTAALAVVTATARTLLDDPDTTTMRATLSVPGLTTVNTFTAQQVVQAAAHTLQVYVDQSGTASAGPTVELRRANTTVAANDFIGQFSITGRNSSAATVNYTQINTRIADPTAGTETGVLVLGTNQAGTFATRVSVGAGIYTPGATGGDKGVDTVNAKQIMEDGARLLPVGMVVPYAGQVAPAKWLFCYGQNVSRTTYAALFTALGTIHGAGDGSTTFGLPDMRGRAAAGKDDMGGSAANILTTAGGGIDGITLGAKGGVQSRTIGSSNLPAHTHAVSITSGAQSADHTHGFNVNSGTENANHQHAFSGTTARVNLATVNFTSSGGGACTLSAMDSENAAHLHNVPGNTGGASAAHTHLISGATDNGPGTGVAMQQVQPSIIMNYMIYAGV